MADMQISQGKTRDFLPTYPPHIRFQIPDGFGLWIFMPPRPPENASYAIRVPRAGDLPAAAFPHHLAMMRLPFG